MPAQRIYLTSWAWLLLLARVAERGLGEEGNESGDGSGDSETFLSSSAQLWGNQRDEGGDSGSIGSLGCDFHSKVFSLRVAKNKKTKTGHPGCLCSSWGFLLTTSLDSPLDRKPSSFSSNTSVEDNSLSNFVV